MIKTLKTRFNVDRRGKITTGIKKLTANGKEYPSTTDYFVVDDFPEIKEIYGEKPKKLVIIFPDDELLNFFDVNYVLYGSNNQIIRKCDGEECVHRIDEELDLVGRYDNDELIEAEEVYKGKYVAGEITKCVCKLMAEEIIRDGKTIRNPKLCNTAMYMKAFILNYKNGRIISPNCYLFYSGSENTAGNIYSELIKIKNFFGGRIKGLPFGLSVEMVAGKIAKTKFPIWNLQILGSISQLQNLLTESFMFDYKDIISLGAKEQNKLLGSHKEEDKFDESNPLGL